MKSGICSITFRKLTPTEVIRLAAEAGLDAIEWGGDVHAPPDRPQPDLAAIRRATEDAGLAVSSYGSYYKVFDEADPKSAFSRVLDAAQALGAPVVRVWTRGTESQDADEAYFQRAAEAVRLIADMAAPRGLRIAFEFHSKTLTNTAWGTKRLIELTARDNVGAYWQPLPRTGDFSYADELRTLRPWLEHVHCYYWVGSDRRLIEEGGALWQPLLKQLAATGFNNTVMLEFTREDSPENMKRDAAALRKWIREAGADRRKSNAPE